MSGPNQFLVCIHHLMVAFENLCNFDLQVEDNITSDYRRKQLENSDNVGKKKHRSSTKYRDGSSTRNPSSSKKMEELVECIVNRVIVHIDKRMAHIAHQCAEVTPVLHSILFTAR